MRRQLEAEVASLLQGVSPIDWSRLRHFSDEGIADLLTSNGFNLQNEEDWDHLDRLRDRGVSYMNRALDMVVDSDLFEMPVDGLIHVAARRKEGRQRRKQACVLLKVMHLIQRLDARSLRFAARVSDAELTTHLLGKVGSWVDGLRRQGLVIVEWGGGHKRPDAMVTKLLLKTSSQVGNVHDQVRVRLVTEDQTTVVAVIEELVRHILPFNMILAGESVNTLMDVEADALKGLVPDFAIPERPYNPQSSGDYRIVNLVGDVPLAIDPTSYGVPKSQQERHGCIVHLRCEFQFVDVATAQDNERGEQGHSAYKKRQIEVVRRRLGL
ncbi:MAG: TIGR04552 family protein [Myxococcota bacterium]|nr:TIGR04552 family protein [Myxococcota bacterium]